MGGGYPLVIYVALKREKMRWDTVQLHIFEWHATDTVQVQETVTAGPRRVNRLYHDGKISYIDD